MSRQQLSGAIAYQEGQGPGSGPSLGARFAVLAVSFFMTIADPRDRQRRRAADHRPASCTCPNRACNGSSPATRLPSAASCCSAGRRRRDLLGRRRILMVGLAVFTAALGWAAGWRTAEGFPDRDALPARARARRSCCPRALVDRDEHVPRRRRGGTRPWARGGPSEASGRGPSGVMAGGLLTRYAGWQYIFFLNVPIGAAALLLAPRLGTGQPTRYGTPGAYDPFGRGPR